VTVRRAGQEETQDARSTEYKKNPPVLQFKGLPWNLLAANNGKKKVQRKQNRTKQNINPNDYSGGRILKKISPD
jgi:hypothetical protein